MTLDWTWELGGTGPRFLLSLQLGRGAGVAGTLPADLVRTANGFWEHRDNGEFAVLSVAVRAGEAVITRGCLTENPGDERELAERLLSAGPLGDWQVSAGGDGYPAIHVRAGAGEASLRTYCGRRPPPSAPDPGLILPLVAAELAAHGLDRVYRPGAAQEVEREAGERLSVPLHDRATGSNVPRFGTDLDPVARALSRRCDMAVTAMAGDPHRPLPRPAGSLRFGR